MSERKETADIQDNLWEDLPMETRTTLLMYVVAMFFLNTEAMTPTDLYKQLPDPTKTEVTELVLKLKEREALNGMILKELYRLLPDPAKEKVKEKALKLKKGNAIGIRVNLNITDPSSPDALSESERRDEDDLPQELDNFIRGINSSNRIEDVLPVSKSGKLLPCENGNYRKGFEYKPLPHGSGSGTGPCGDQEVLDTATLLAHSVRTINTTEPFLPIMIKIWVALSGSVYFRTLHLMCLSDNKVHFHMTNCARYDTLSHFKKRLNQLREQKPELEVPVILKILMDLLHAQQFMTKKQCTLNNIKCGTVMINRDGLSPVFDDFTRAALLQNLEDMKNDFLGIQSVFFYLLLPEGVELQQFVSGTEYLDEDKKKKLLQLINCFDKVISNNFQEGYFSRIITVVQEELKKEHLDIENIIKQATPILYPPALTLRNHVRLATSPDCEVLDLQAMWE